MSRRARRAGHAGALARAHGAHREGRLDDAEAAYREVLRVAPEHPEALHGLGLLRHQQGRTRQAVRMLEAACRQRPADADLRLNLAGVREAAGDLAGAAAGYREVVRLEPDAVDAHFNLGLVELRRGEPEAAARCFERAVALAPDDAQARYQLGRALLAAGRPAAAIETLEAALARAPRLRAAWVELGRAARAGGDAGRAEAAYRRALELEPRDPAVLNNLANVLHEAGRLGEAAQHYRRAVELAPAEPTVALNLARLLAEQGDARGALEALRAGGARAPGSRPVLAEALRGVRPAGPDATLEGECLACLDDADVDPQPLARTVAALVLLRHGLAGAPDEALAERAARAEAGLCADRLLRGLLRRCVNVDPRLEVALAGLRRRLAERRDAGSTLDADALATASALGLQGFANEWVVEATAGERAAPVRAARRLARHLAADPGGPVALDAAAAADAAVVAMYGSLLELPGAERLPGAPAPAPVAELVARTVADPLDEARRRPGIETLAPVEREVSRAVRAQYEESPYPRWVTPPPPRASSLAAQLHRRLGVSLPREDPRRALRVLVAGCGTGYEPIGLARAPGEAHVTAIDLSRSSLAYAERMAERLGLAGLRFVHGDLLDAGRLGERFDVVYATGVLHHLRDPAAGLRALAGCLAPGGVMRLALYSERARAPILAVRRDIAARGLEPSVAALREVRREILRAPPGDPRAVLARSDDLYSLSGTRDLLFHVEEHAFTPAVLARRLAEAGLETLAVEPPDAVRAARYRAVRPGDRRLRDLGVWERLEAEDPGAFEGMIHLWCARAAD